MEINFLHFSTVSISLVQTQYLNVPLVVAKPRAKTLNSEIQIMSEYLNRRLSLINRIEDRLGSWNHVIG